MNTAMQLKTLIRNLAKNKGINPQTLLRNYMFERLLERVSASKYKHNFILKGGMLISAIVGIASRSTMDMDVTIKGIPVSKESIKRMFEEILKININDNVNMRINNVSDIRIEEDYAGFSVNLTTIFDGIIQNLKIDITTGDKITPYEINYKFKLLFEDRMIDVLAYNLETVIAEKLETIISRGTTNTRMRDFYDIYILTKVKADNMDQKLLCKAITETINQRGKDFKFENKDLIVFEVKESSLMKDLWRRYQKNYSYAENVSWEEVLNAVEKVIYIL